MAEHGPHLGPTASARRSEGNIARRWKKAGGGVCVRLRQGRDRPLCDHHVPAAPGDHAWCVSDNARPVAEPVRLFRVESVSRVMRSRPGMRITLGRRGRRRAFKPSDSRHLAARSKAQGVSHAGWITDLAAVARRPPRGIRLAVDTTPSRVRAIQRPIEAWRRPRDPASDDHDAEPRTRRRC